MSIGSISFPPPAKPISNRFEWIERDPPPRPPFPPGARHRPPVPPARGGRGGSLDALKPVWNWLGWGGDIGPPFGPPHGNRSLQPILKLAKGILARMDLVSQGEIGPWRPTLALALSKNQSGIPCAARGEWWPDGAMGGRKGRAAGKRCVGLRPLSPHPPRFYPVFLPFPHPLPRH